MSPKKSITFEDVERDYRRLAKTCDPQLEFYYQIIRLMHQIMKSVGKKFVRDKIKYNRSRSGITAIIDIYEIKILNYFLSHYHILKSGTALASYLPLRTIYENILRIYINKCYPSTARITEKYEVRLNSGLTPEEIIKVEKEYFNLGRRLGHGYVIKHLFNTAEHDIYKNFYEQISLASHSSIQSVSACYELRKDIFIDSLKLGVGLTYMNIILLFELYGNNIDRKYKNKMKSYMKSYHLVIPEGLPLFIPTLNVCNS